MTTTDSTRSMPADRGPAIPGNAIEMASFAMIEPAAPFTAFEPSWFNVWEASLHQRAVSRTGSKTWLFRRFGQIDKGHAQESLRKADYREVLNGLSQACKLAFDEIGKKNETSIRKGRTALVYFDAWGESSVFEAANSWRDAFSLDILPKAIARDYMASEFSCKVRGERSGFLHGLQLATDLLNASSVDTVLLCGQYRAYPVMVLSNAVDATLHGASASHCSVERALCMVLRQQSGEGTALRIAEYFPLPERRPDAREQLAHKWRERLGASTGLVYGASHPCAKTEELEREALARLDRKARYVPLYPLYGDSACLNPAMAFVHMKAQRKASRETSAHVLINANDGQGGIWLLECWPRTGGAR